MINLIRSSAISVLTSMTSVSLFNLYLPILTMDKGSRDGEHTSKEVIIVISRKIKLGFEKEYR